MQTNFIATRGQAIFLHSAGSFHLEINLIIHVTTSAMVKGF
eukprot:COSAG02_NODE_148_length_33809_cov_158.369594_11_plen_41_part_00